MKPKLLEIEGLQSFTDTQRIDFEELSQSGLFGIFGPTGSGKSTILDAITFALYGRVKRAEGGTQGIINSGRNTARVSFTFELLKDGRRRTYRAERVYQRRKNSPNSCEPKITRFIEVTDSGDIPLCDKAMEMSYYIKDLLGLSNDDFTRAVVLPQNSFQEFLLLNNSERRGMLERIFYLEEYGKQLTEKLGRKMAGLKSRLDIMTGELRGYADASDEALLEAEKAAETTAEQKNNAEEALKKLEVKYNEAKEVWGISEELAEFVRKEAEHTALKAQFDQKRIWLEKAIKADALSEMIQKNRELHKNIEQTKKQLKEVLAVLPGVFTSLNGTKAEYERIKKKAAMEQPGLLSRKARLADGLVIKDEIESISASITRLDSETAALSEGIAHKEKLIMEETQRLTLLAKDIERLSHEAEQLKTDPEYRQQLQEGVKLESEAVMMKDSVKELENRLGGAKSSVTGIEQRLAGIKEEIEECAKAMETLTAEKQLHEAAKPGDKNKVLKAMEQIHSVDGTVQVLKLRFSELTQQKAKLEKQKADLMLLEQRAGILNKAMADAAEKLRQCKLDFENVQKERKTNTAAVLAEGLTEGEACPVCGSTEHPAPAVHMEGVELSVLGKKIEETEKMLEDAEADFKAAERETLVAEEQVRTARNQIELTKQDVEQKTVEYEEVRQKLPEKLQGLEPDQVCREVERVKTSYKKKLEDIECWELKLEEYKENLNKCNETLSEKRLIENGFVAELKVSLEGLEQLRESAVKANKALDEVQSRYSAFLAEHHIDDVSTEFKRIVQNDRTQQTLQKKLEKIREASEAGRGQIDKLNSELRQLNNEHVRIEAQRNELRKQKQTGEIKLKELAGDADIQDEIRSIDEQLQAYAGQQEELANTLASLDRHYNELSGRKSMLENQLNIYSTSLEKEENRLGAILAEKGFTDTGDVENSILSKEDQMALKKSLEEYDRVLVNLQAQTMLLRKKLKGRSITADEWESVNREYTELQAYKLECVSNAEVAKSTLSSLKKKHETWQKLGKTYNEMSHRLGLFEQIQKILRAEHRKDNSFIDYIAEERLRYVAAKASETLGLMTNHRYGLELDTHTGFIIRDQSSGGAHRMVTSLSGGEIFLTSLSLALALSEQIQLKGQSPLEFFFLDEGFGTLDQDLLDTVIDSLVRLSSTDRVIGLISHVPELKSRIVRRLIVDPPTLQGDGSRIKIEKA